MAVFPTWAFAARSAIVLVLVTCCTLTDAQLKDGVVTATLSPRVPATSSARGAVTMSKTSSGYVRVQGEFMGLSPHVIYNLGVHRDVRGSGSQPASSDSPCSRAVIYRTDLGTARADGNGRAVMDVTTYRTEIPINVILALGAPPFNPYDTYSNREQILACGDAQVVSPTTPTTTTVAPMSSTNAMSPAVCPSDMTQKQKVVALLNSVLNKDPAPRAFINPTKYVQHNLGAADGLAGFVAMTEGPANPANKMNLPRVFQDGNYIFAHADALFEGDKVVGFDVFRIDEQGLLAEHWDNYQMAAAPNPSGHTNMDGPIMAENFGETQANKDLAKKFVEDVLIKGEMGNAMKKFFNGFELIQHSVNQSDGVLELAILLATQAAAKSQQYTQVRRVLGEGNFVLTMSEGTRDGKAAAFYDLWRVAGGKIAEHWDVVETIPPRDEWKNKNGKF